MKERVNILVLMGGRSPEHEISLISGREVVGNLDKNKYNILPTVVTRDGKDWRLTSKESLLALPNPMELKETGKELLTSNYQEIGNVNQMENVDVVFIAMHGPFGEDGTVQGMLELAGLPYTGSGVLASAISMDKLMFRKLMNAEDILVPNFVALTKKSDPSEVNNYLGEPPYFVKPHNQGSSVGNSIVRTKEELDAALILAWEYSDTALVDEYIKGREITCAILGNQDLEIFPLIEIVPKGEYFDYDSKYAEGGAEEIVPAQIDSELAAQIQDIAKKVYLTAGCRGFGRVDFILKNNTTPVVLEINTIPGLTPMSLFPKAAKAAGISYQELLNRVIGYALE